MVGCMAEAESDEIRVNTDEMGDAQCEYPPCSVPRTRIIITTTTAAAAAAAATTTTTATTTATTTLRSDQADQLLRTQGLVAQRCRRC